MQYRVFATAKYLPDDINKDRSWFSLRFEHKKRRTKYRDGYL